MAYLHSPQVIRSFAVALGLSTALLPSPASACGGFFCSQAAPVNQAAERIIFAQDGDTTTQIVEILYEGPSERFAWVLPVPGVPDISVSSGIVFQRLQAATNPSYQLIEQFANCGSDSSDGFGASSPGASSGGGSAINEGGGPTVTVLDEGSVGPFDFQIIEVDPADQDPAEVAVTWLEDNEYDVTSLGGDVLRPYLENGLNLLAVRLQKGIDSGAIQPLSLTFSGAQPSIPIRPTAVAANDDMGVLVWLLGESRAVPTNYLGLELNEALIDWTNPAPTYDAVVTAAANEAGGQGFVTELAGPAAPYATSIDPGFDVLDRSSYTNLLKQDILFSIVGRFANYDGFLRVFSQHVAFRDELTAEDFIACPNCYVNPQYYANRYTPVDYGDSYDESTDPINATDISALFDAIDEEVLAPIHDAAALFETNSYVTRLYTTMSADDMTLDPVFDFNADLEDVSNVHTATRVWTCDGPWSVELPDGQIVQGTGSSWPLSALAPPEEMPFNTRVVAFSTQGLPRVEVDNQELIFDLLGQAPGSGGDGSGGSMNASGGNGSSKDGLERDGGLCSTAAVGLRRNAAWMWPLTALLAAAAYAPRRRSRRPQRANRTL